MTERPDSLCAMTTTSPSSDVQPTAASRANAIALRGTADRRAPA